MDGLLASSLESLVHAYSDAGRWAEAGAKMEQYCGQFKFGTKCAPYPVCFMHMIRAASKAGQDQEVLAIFKKSKLAVGFKFKVALRFFHAGVGGVRRDTRHQKNLNPSSVFTSFSPLPPATQSPPACTHH